MHVRSIRIETEWRVKIGIAGALGIASGLGVPNDRKTVGRHTNNFVDYRIKRQFPPNDRRISGEARTPHVFA